MTTSLRYPGGLEPSTSADLVDNLSACFNRCKAVVDLIRAVQESEDASIMDDTISNACWSVLADLEDGQATLDGWRDRTRGQDPLAGIDNRALIYRGLVDTVGSEIEADRILQELDKLLAVRHG